VDESDESDESESDEERDDGATAGARNIRRQSPTSCGAMMPDRNKLDTSNMSPDIAREMSK
jgi:hypothetical protein